MTETQQLPFEGWAVLELMGHRRLGGYVREQSVAGAGFIRIEVPGDDPGSVVATQLYSPSALYSLTPTSEDVARAVALRNRIEPVTPWELTAIEAPRSRPRPSVVQIEPRDDDERGVVINVTECSSCGGSHDDVETRWLDPTTEVYVCPTSGAQAFARAESPA